MPRDHAPSQSAADKQNVMEFDTLDLSDMHLGKNVAQAALLFEFLSQVRCRRLVLNGDILDGWKLMAKKHRKMPEMHMRVMDCINALAASGSEVVYIAGNHDDRLRGHWDKKDRKIKTPSAKKKPRNILDHTYDFTNHVTGEHCPVTITDSYEFTDPAGRKKKYFHGDQLDPRGLKTKKGQKLSKVGDVLYDTSVALNAKMLKKAREKGEVKSGQFSLSKYLKHMAKEKFGIIDAFEKAILEGTQDDIDIIGCGHIHFPELRDNYHNSGDWVESATAIGCDENGVWRMINWEDTRHVLGYKTPPTEEDENPFAAYRNVTQRQMRWARRFWPAKNADELNEALDLAQQKLRREIAKWQKKTGQSWYANDNQEIEKPPKLLKKEAAIRQQRAELLPY